MENRKVSYLELISGMGIILLVLSLYHLCWWGWHENTELRLHVIPGIIFLTLTAWILTLILLKYLKRSEKFGDGKLNTRFTGFNSIMIFSQFLDGTATYVGLDFYGYQEKHVLPSIMIEFTGTAAVMYLLKFLVAIFAIYIIDVEYRNEMEQYPVLAGLIKIVVVVLGLAPGTRDMLRLAFGT